MKLKGADFKSFKYILDLIVSEIELEDNEEQDIRTKTIVTVVMSAVSLILTIFNIVKGYTVMTIATSVLAFGFAAAAVIVGKFRNRNAGMLIVAVLVIVVFTFFAISGRNDGFAILWILLVPMVASNILNMRMGLVISLYFQLLLVAMFYTNWSVHFIGLYTSTFMGRFPVLYLAGFVSSYIITLQKQHYAKIVERLAYMDALTGLANRQRYDQILNKLDNSDKDVDLIAMDLNGLKRANDTIGHDAGDELIKAAADCIKSSFADALVCARTGGDEFVVITDAKYAELEKQIAELREMQKNWKGQYSDELSISFGMANRYEIEDGSMERLASLADNRMYENKANYYRESGRNRRRS